MLGENLTSNTSDPCQTNEQGSLRDLCNIPGFQESVLCLSGIALHGLVVNGLLQWVDIQRRTVPANQWKEKALRHFSAAEISSAKNQLWDVCDEKVVGRLVTRQGAAKSQAELNDIENTFKILAERQVMPVFVASTVMVMQTPLQDISPLSPSSKDIETIVENVMKKHTGQLEKKSINLKV